MLFYALMLLILAVIVAVSINAYRKEKNPDAKEISIGEAWDIVLSWKIWVPITILLFIIALIYDHM